jgi:hypothetical protein
VKRPQGRFPRPLRPLGNAMAAIRTVSGSLRPIRALDLAAGGSASPDKSPAIGRMKLKRLALPFPENSFLIRELACLRPLIPWPRSSRRPAIIPIETMSPRMSHAIVNDFGSSTAWTFLDIAFAIDQGLRHSSIPTRAMETQSVNDGKANNRTVLRHERISSARNRMSLVSAAKSAQTRTALRLEYYASLPRPGIVGNMAICHTRTIRTESARPA